MALTERATLGAITILSDGQLQVRVDTVVEKDGHEIARNYHRYVVNPGDDLSGELARTQTIGRAVHTPDVIKAFDQARTDKEVSRA